jgi:cell division inhibitor SulA
MENCEKQTTFDYEGSARPHTRIMELVVPDDLRQQAPLLLSVVSHLSRQADGRWLTCIGTSFLTKRECLDYRIDWQRLLQVMPNGRVGGFDLAERALAARRSHTVVFVAPRSPTPHQLYRLEQAATVGQCQGLLIHGR